MKCLSLWLNFKLLVARNTDNEGHQLLLLLLSLILLDSSIMFTISAGSNPGSGALMGSHGLHSIDRTFRRMWLDPKRAIF